MFVAELKELYPLVYKALDIIASDNGCTLSQDYEFPGCVTPTIVIAQCALEQLSGRKVVDVINIGDIPEICRWEWDAFGGESALEHAACSEASYMDALCAAIEGGDVLSRFLSECFDGMYVKDAAERQLMIYGC